MARSTSTSDETAEAAASDEKVEYPAIEPVKYSDVAEAWDLYQPKGYVAASETTDSFTFGKKKYDGGVFIAPDAMTSWLALSEDERAKNPPEEADSFVLTKEEFHERYVPTAPAKQIIT